MEIREVIEFALEKEVMSRRMYERVAERCDSDEARMMLLQLARAENVTALNLSYLIFVVNTCIRWLKTHS